MIADLGWLAAGLAVGGPWVANVLEVYAAGIEPLTGRGHHRLEPLGCRCRQLRHGVLVVSSRCAEHRARDYPGLPADAPEPIDLDG